MQPPILLHQQGQRGSVKMGCRTLYHGSILHFYSGTACTIRSCELHDMQRTNILISWRGAHNTSRLIRRESHVRFGRSNDIGLARSLALSHALTHTQSHRGGVDTISMGSSSCITVNKIKRLPRIITMERRGNAIDTLTQSLRYR